MRHLTLLSLALCVAAAPCANPLGAQASDDAAAAALLEREDWRGAIDAYRRLVRRSPERSETWLSLGIAYHGAGQLDSAAAAFERAIAADTTAVPPHMRLARVRAARGAREDALRHLEHAVARGFASPQALAGMRELDALRDDPRFRALADRVTTRRYPCRSDPAARQLDFWVGTWDVTAAGRHAGTNEIALDLEQCALVERWAGASGLRGTSLNFYDRNARRWRQVWVADNGWTLDLAGAFRDGAMRFEGVTTTAEGARTLHKLTFFPVAKDTVRQLFEDSSDGGATWTTTFDGLYVRRR